MTRLKLPKTFYFYFLLYELKKYNTLKVYLCWGITLSPGHLSQGHFEVKSVCLIPCVLVNTVVIAATYFPSWGVHASFPKPDFRVTCQMIDLSVPRLSSAVDPDPLFAQMPDLNPHFSKMSYSDFSKGSCLSLSFALPLLRVWIRYLPRCRIRTLNFKRGQMIDLSVPSLSRFVGHSSPPPSLSLT